jgi:hypothetical protein
MAHADRSAEGSAETTPRGDLLDNIPINCYAGFWLPDRCDTTIDPGAATGPATKRT